MSKILTFRVCSEDFAKFSKENLRSRFREDTSHWKSRLVDKDGNFKKFDEIKVVNGYKSDSPTMIFEFKNIVPATDENGKIGFEINFGEVKEILNIL